MPIPRMNMTDFQLTVYKRAKPLDSLNKNLEHAVYGIMSEGGEIADCIKKHVIYNKPLDTENLREEVGDILWYIALLANSMEWNLEMIMAENNEKLEKRYPLGVYSNLQATARADKVGESNE